MEKPMPDTFWKYSRQLSFGCSILVAGIGILAIGGWLLDIHWLRSGWPGLPSMTLTTAIAGVFSGTGLALLNHSSGRYRYFSQWFFAASLTIGWIGLSQHVWDLNLDQPFTRSPDGNTLFAQRMGVNVIACLILSGLSGIILARRPGKPLAAQLLATLTFIIAYTALLGYAYQVRSWYSIREYTAMGLTTSLSFLLLSAGLLLPHLDQGILKQFTGLTLRKRMPLAYVVYLLLLPPVLLGLLLMAYRQGFLSIESEFLIFAVGFTAVSGVVFLLKLRLLVHQKVSSHTIQTTQEELARSNRKLSAANAELQSINEQLRRNITQLNAANATIERLSAEALRQSERRYTEVVENFYDAFYALDEHLHIVYWNHKCEQLTGYPEAAVLGKDIMDIFTHLRGTGIDQVHRAVLASRTPQTYQHEYVYQGYKNYFELNIYPIEGGLAALYKNITARVEAQQEYRELAESITDMFFAINNEFRYTYWNRACETFTGIPAADVLGKQMQEVFPHLANSTVEATFQRVLLEQQPVSLVLEPDDYSPTHTAFIEVSIYPSRQGLSVFVKDISERKRAEQKITQMVTELKNYKLALDKSALISITDPEGNITHVNDLFCQVSQYHREELLGRNHRIVNSGFHNQDYFTELWDTIRAGQLWRGEIKNRAKDGSFYWEDTVINPITDEEGNIRHFLSIRYDITRRKQSEEKLAESEQLYRSIAENFPGYILIIAPDTTVLFLEGKDAGVHTGLSPDIIGTPVFAAFQPEETANLTRHLLSALQGNASSVEFSANGRFLSFTLHPICNRQEGNVEKILGVITDITERKKLHAQMIELKNLKLQQADENRRIRSAALIAGMEKERTRVSKELHDGIGQTLNVVKLKADTLKANCPQLSGQMQELVNLTSQTIGDVRDLIRDMSSYSLQHLGIESAIRNLIRTYEQHTELAIHFQTWITLKDEKSIPPPVALSVFRIVQEGINNIIKHARATHVTVQLTELPDAFLLMIEDDGIGFDYPEKKRSRDSYGLQNMAERCLVLNAELDIDSKPGHGCTINIRIPKSKKPDPYDYAS